MAWIVKPYIGLSELHFNESAERAIEINGQPIENDIINERKNKLIFGIHKPAITLLENKIVEIACHHDISDNVIFDNIDIFKDDEDIVLKKLRQKENIIYELYGFLIFIKLGITLTGFHDRDINQKAMTMFASGYYWAEKINEMTPLDI